MVPWPQGDVRAPAAALTWVQDGLDDVPVPPLGLHALQLLGLVPLAALLLLLLPGVLRGADGGSVGRGLGLGTPIPAAWPRPQAPGSPFSN